jgi:hypothetical protein
MLLFSRLTCAGLLPLVRMIKATVEDAADADNDHEQTTFPPRPVTPLSLGGPMETRDTHLPHAVRGDDYHAAGRVHAHRATYT